jgi:rhodanese-related sulfurtransferase
VHPASLTEYADGYADTNAEHQDQLPGKYAPVLLCCRSESMSTSAARDLVALHYTNVLEVDGGFGAWQASGHELLHNR